MSRRRTLALTCCVLSALAGAACSSDEADPTPQKDPDLGPVTEVISGTLDLDIRNSANVRLELRRERVDAQLIFDQGFGVIPESADQAGVGRVVRLPESDTVMYTAKWSVEPQPGGPCGAEPVSLSLVLHRRGPTELVVGGITPYCGKDRYFGVPARAPLRLSGPIKAKTPANN